jgi:hypothetical protein
MPTDTETEPVKTDTREQAAAKRKLTAVSEKVAISKAKTKELSKQLDEEVAAARDARVTYRDIATAAGRSVAWVQASLKKTKESATTS